MRELGTTGAFLPVLIGPAIRVRVRFWRQEDTSATRSGGGQKVHGGDQWDQTEGTWWRSVGSVQVVGVEVRRPRDGWLVGMPGAVHGAAHAC